MRVLRVRTLILLVIALGLIEFHAYGQRPKPAKEDRCHGRTVEDRNRYASLQVHGLRAVLHGNPRPADGYLAEVSVKEGQTVKKGDPLFTIRPPKDEEKLKADDRDQADFAELGQAVMGSDPLFRLLPPESSRSRRSITRTGSSLSRLLPRA